MAKGSTEINSLREEIPFQLFYVRLLINSLGSFFILAELELDQRNSVFQSSFGLKNEPRPHFAGRIHNVTVNVGREAVLECPVNHLGHYKVGQIKSIEKELLKYAN